MSYKITYSTAVRKQIDGLPGHIKAMARQRIATLSDTPRPPKSVELADHPNCFRLWLSSDYRLVWHVMDDEQMIEIEYVGPKPPDLYDRLGLGRAST